MARIMKAAVVAASLFVIAPANAGMTDSASPNDTARVLAGLRPSAGSPLVSLTQDGSWQQHASRFDSIFGSVDRRQLDRIRAWSSAKLTSPSDVLFYMFSGPDFLYANAFFPNATTYVMSGLEPVGPIPDLARFSRGTVGAGLRNIEGSLRSILAYSFFQTKEMRRELVATPVRGTLPILYVFLARSGKTIRDVTLIRLDENGSVLPDNEAEGGKGARGAKIVFAGSDGRERTLYYFGTNVANDGFKASGFAKFCERLGTGDALVKSASYLLHDSGFSDVRNFLLTHTRLMLQDDTGVPVTYLDRGNWQLRPFGHYIGPISIFPGKYQPKLARLFDKGREFDRLRHRVPLAVAGFEPADGREDRRAAPGGSGEHSDWLRRWRSGRRRSAFVHGERSAGRGRRRAQVDGAEPVHEQQQAPRPVRRPFPQAAGRLSRPMVLLVRGLALTEGRTSTGLGQRLFAGARIIRQHWPHRIAIAQERAGAHHDHVSLR